MNAYLDHKTPEHTFLHKSMIIRNKILELVEEQHILVEQYLMQELETENERDNLTMD